MNVMDKYLKILNEDINEFLKYSLEKKYKKYITDELFNSYINARYGIEEGRVSTNSLRRNVAKSLEEKKNELCKKNPEKQQIIEIHTAYISYIQYLDNLIQPESQELEKLLKKIELDEKIKKQLELCKKSHDLRIKNYLSQFESKDFYLEFKSCPKKQNTSFVELAYNISFPVLYSNFAIHQAFTTGKINEDKYLVLYYMLSVNIISDLINNEYNKEYIVRFPATIFEKKQKFNRLIDIVNHYTIKDKICFVIEYNQFKNHKKDFNAFIKKGFNVAIELNQKVDAKEAMRMEIFKYIILNKELNYSNELRKTNKNLNIIELKD